MRKNPFFFSKKSLLCIIINLPVETIISKFSYRLKMMLRNTFSEPQPDSASYAFSCWFISIWNKGRHCVFQLPRICCFHWLSKGQHGTDPWPTDTDYCPLSKMYSLLSIGNCLLASVQLSLLLSTFFQLQTSANIFVLVCSVRWSKTFILYEPMTMAPLTSGQW